MGKFQSTKIFDNYTIALRQWKSQHSHCQFLHGYALEFKVWFAPVDQSENDGLDDMNWVVDFGGFKDSGNGEKEGVVLMTRAIRRLRTFYEHSI